MFVAKFSTTTGAPFTADKNGNFPLIGTVVAGKAKGSIINGTIFEREGLSAGKLYLCENSVDPAYPQNVQTSVIAEVSALELVSMRKELGEAVNLQTKSAEVPAETPPAEVPLV